MLLSVIIPTFNSEKYLDRAMNSVLKQTYKDYEIIIIDDCSTDNTRALIETYAKQHDGIIRHQFLDRNGGPAVARNVGLAMAKGDYISFLDSDDEWANEKIQKQIKLLEENPGVTIVGCIRQSCNADGEIEPEEVNIPKITEDGWLRLLTGTFLCTPSVVIRKSAIIGEFFYTDLSVSEDRELWIRIARKGQLGFVPEVLVTTYSDGNYMIDNEEQSVNNLLPMLQFKFARYKEEIPAYVKRNAYGNAYTILGKGYGEKGKYILCLYYLIKAIFLGHRIFDNLNTIINLFPPIKFIKNKMRSRSN